MPKTTSTKQRKGNNGAVAPADDSGAPPSRAPAVSPPAQPQSSTNGSFAGLSSAPSRRVQYIKQPEVVVAPMKPLQEGFFRRLWFRYTVEFAFYMLDWWEQLLLNLTVLGALIFVGGALYAYVLPWFRSHPIALEDVRSVMMGTVSQLVKGGKPVGASTVAP